MTATAMVELRPGITGGRMAVGVAELTGLAPIRRFLDIPHLEQIYAAFDGVCRGVLAARSGLLAAHGDRVVYAVAHHDDAVAIARELVAEAAHDALLPPPRVGVASGTVLVSAGQCYGPAVDLAARRMADAHPGTISERG